MLTFQSQYREWTVGPLKSEPLKSVSSCMSHYASHYHYGSQSIAFSGQWECRTGWSQPVNCINIEGHIALLSEPTVHSLYCVSVLGKNTQKKFSPDPPTNTYNTTPNFLSPTTICHLSTLSIVWSLFSMVQVLKKSPVFKSFRCMKMAMG
jgi:hypothetical protein